MNKLYVLILFLIIVSVLIFSSCSSKDNVDANSDENQEITAFKSIEPSCPRGLINDHSPGKCYLYEDDDNNNICDLSE